MPRQRFRPPGEVISRRIRVLTLQVCGKCIGGAVRRWSSAATPIFGHRDKSKADRSRKKRERWVQTGSSTARHSKSEVDTARSGEKTLPGMPADAGGVSSKDKSFGRRLMRPRQIRRI